MNKIILVIALFATAVYAAPEWDGLRVTWDFNPLNLWAFNGMPRSLGELKSDFQLRDDQCKTPNAKFLGQRYWYKEDPAITLLYDTKGTIAGIQTSIPKANYTPTATSAGRNYVDDGNYWTLTAYFVDPSTICADGRSQDQLKSEGTGSNLYLQHGPNPIQDSVAIPRSEEEAKKTLWGHGKCFYTMGQHYWYNVSKDMNCDDFVPNCLMYNKGRLTAFCFAANVVLPSRRYEHPTNQQAKMFLDPVPDCYYKDPSYKKTSTIHVYMIDAPRTRSLC